MYRSIFLIIVVVGFASGCVSRSDEAERQLRARDELKRRVEMEMSRNAVRQKAGLLNAPAEATHKIGGSVPKTKDKLLVEKLHHAIKAGDINDVRRVLDESASAANTVMNAVDEDDGQTALHVAASSGTISIVQLLLERGANINGRDSAEETPLHSAVLAEKGEMVDLLLVRGANAKLADYRGSTAFQFCSKNGYDSEVLGKESPAACFIRHGEQVNLVQAIPLGLVDQVEQLLRRPGDPLEGVYARVKPRTAASYIYYLSLLCDQTCRHLDRTHNHPSSRADVMKELLDRKRPVFQKIAALSPQQTLDWGVVSGILEESDLALLKECADLGLKADVSEPLPAYEQICRRAAAHSPEVRDLLRKIGFPV